jgi:hypothetical protein
MMDQILWLDYETKCVEDLEEVGLDNYLASPTFEIIMGQYASGDGKVHLWEPHKQSKIPAQLEDALLDPFVTAHAHHANFERQASKRAFGIDKPTTEWVCTMAMARYAGLPGKLEEAGAIMQLGNEAKLASGKELIRLFCEPVDVGGEDTLFGISKPRFNTPYTHPAEWAKFCEYGVQDVIAERALEKKLLKYINISQEEWENWRLEAKINQTGWSVDLLVVNNAAKIALQTREPLLARMKELTGLSNVESRNQVLGWVRDQGYLFDSLGKDFIARALAGDCGLTPEGKEVLELRLQTAKSSVSKYTALADMTAKDARLRYQYTYYGAHTGREAAHGVNVGNLFKPTKDVENRLDLAVNLVRKMDYDEIVRQFKNPLDVAAGVQRSSFRAPEGKKFVWSDLNAIENRVLQYLSRCEALGKVYKEFYTYHGPDATEYGTGKPIKDGMTYPLDPYLMFAVGMFKMSYHDLWIEWKVKGDSAKRTICKPPVLGGGYALGPGEEREDCQTGLKFYSGLMGYSRNMGVEMTQEQCAQAIGVLRRDWKEVTWLWKDMERAAAFAIRHPGHLTGVGVPELQWEFNLFERLGRTIQEPRLWFKCHSDKVMEMILPSGRPLYYWNPRVETQQKTWTGMKDGREVTRSYEQDVIFYHAKDPKTKQWVETDTFGGHLVENCLSGGTKVLTNNGTKSIINLEKNDLLWDGVEWVSHGGLINQGLQETIEWQGIWGTREHLILVGNEWVELQNVESRTVGALSTGRDLVTWWFNGLNPEKEAVADSYATAEKQERLKSGTLSGKMLLSVPTAHGNLREEADSKIQGTTSLKTTTFGKHGCTVEPESFLDAAIQLARLITTTAAEGLRSISRGLTTYRSGYATLSAFPIGTNRTPIWTERTTAATMNPEIFELSQGKRTLTTQETIYQSSSRGVHTPEQSLQKSFSLLGPKMPLGGTLDEGSLRDKSSRDIIKQEVFDIRNSGPRNRFTVLTSRGPVIVHNCDQGEARDILFDGLKRADAMGFEVVGSTYDEVVCLTDIDSGLGSEQLCECLATPHERYKGELPLAAEGTEDIIYHK